MAAKAKFLSLLNFYHYQPLGIIFPDGELWREQRRFASTTLRLIGRGEGNLEGRVLEEISHLEKHIQSLFADNKTARIRMDNLFDLPCLNVIYSLVNSLRFSYTDSHMINLVEMVDKFTMNNAIGKMVSKAILDFLQKKPLLLDLKGRCFIHQLHFRPRCC